MHKNTNLFSIDIANINIEELISGFCKGANIVYITKSGVLYGAVTEGDVKRYLVEESQTSLTSIINESIKKIQYQSEKQIIEDAEELFSKNEKIQSIPVVDSERKLLFQLDREETDKNKQILDMFIDVLRLENALSQLGIDGSKEILISGAPLCYLKQI